jgi:serine/threonine-protein kinase
VLYEMLTGRPPFEGGSPVAVAAAHAREAVTPVRDLAPGVPAAVAEACEAALLKSPAARPGPASAFAASLRASVGRAAAPTEPDTVAVAPPPATAVLPAAAATETAVLRGEPPARRSAPGWVWAVGAAAVLAGALWLVVASFLGRGSDAPSTSETSPSAPAAAEPTVVVPDVVGDPLRDALRALAGAGITHVEVKSTEKAGPGIVGDVDPAEGSAVDPDKTVTLFVGAPGGGHGGKGKGHDKGGGGHD